MRIVGVVSHQSLGEDEETFLICMEPLYSPSNEGIGRERSPPSNTLNRCNLRPTYLTQPATPRRWRTASDAVAACHRITVSSSAGLGLARGPSAGQCAGPKLRLGYPILSANRASSPLGFVTQSQHTCFKRERARGSAPQERRTRPRTTSPAAGRKAGPAKPECHKPRLRMPFRYGMTRRWLPVLTAAREAPGASAPAGFFP